ncbi:hypothetical protein AAEX37_00483 [Oligella sp. MSHR50489EDL]|uniref:hypothetical protein n=1 Tax=Oligella sp. MSHR50489EDL TaxID=3139409 RepID=UPI003D817B4D
MFKSPFQKIAALLMSGCLCLLLTACQDRTWHQQTVAVGAYHIEAQFPAKPVVLEQPYHLLEDRQEAPINRVQWYAASGESSFNLSYLLVPDHLDPQLVARELLRSMRLKRDPRLQSAPSEFVEEFEQDLPALGEEFNVSIGADSKHLVARAKVLQEGRLIVQLYTAGPESDKNFLKQSERFFEAMSIGATIN